MDAAAIEQIVALGKQPISDSSPVGDPVRYEPVFEQVQQQMDKIGTLSGGGGGPDWSIVIDLSKQILQTKSKDLLVMTYLVVGLLERDGYKGLVAGLQAYDAFLNTFWEACYPKVKPPQGRKNAVQYLVDKVLDQIELREGKRKLEPTGGDKEAVHQGADVAAALDATIGKVFTGQPETPNSIPLVRAYKSLKEKVGPLVADAPPTAAPTATSSDGGSAPAPSLASSAPAMMGDFKTPTQALDAVKKVAKFLLSQNDKDGSGYRLMRAACFGAISEPPKDNLIPAPPVPRKQLFEKLAADGNWPQLLTEAEGQFATTPVWLDCQRFVALALKNCGPMYKGAYDAVVLETVGLFQRMPAIFNVTYKGGIPFADGATKAWVDELAGSMGGGGGGGGGRGGPADAIDAAVGEARKMLSESKTGEAVQRLSAQVDMSGSRRGQFRAQLALAELCLDLGRVNLAISMLEGLEAVVDDYRVGEWEPELAAGVFRSLHSALLKAKATPTPDDKKRMDIVFGRLCRLDPATAFAVDPAAKPK